MYHFSLGILNIGLRMLHLVTTEHLCVLMGIPMGRPLRTILDQACRRDICCPIMQNKRNLIKRVKKRKLSHKD